ncbi:MAG: gluconolaconase, partial [Bacteroidota bacterium]
GSFEGDVDGNLSNSRFNHPRGIAIDGSNIVYVADTGNLKIRRILPGGEVSTYADQIMYSGPTGIAASAGGIVYIVDSNSHRIYAVSPNGGAFSFAGRREGYEDGIGEDAAFKFPRDLAVDRDGNVYIADEGNHKIRKISPEGIVTTVAGDNPGNDDGIADVARFRFPYGLAVDQQGNIFIADTRNHRVRKIVQD